MSLLPSVVAVTGLLGYTGTRKILTTNGVARLNEEETYLTTPIYSFQKGDKEVVLVGTIHLGEQEYFELIQHHLNHYFSQGYAVHYEMVEKDIDRKEELFPEEKRVFDGLDDLFDIYELIENKTNLSFQKSLVSYHPSWTNTDLTLSELSTKICEENLVLPTIDMSALGTIPGPKLDRWLRRAIKYLPLIVSLQTALPLPGKRNKMFREIILEHRNQIALDAISAEDNNVVSVWGSAHLPGIMKALKKDGFNLTSERWLSAVKLKGG